MPPPRGLDFDEAISLVRTVCEIAGSRNLIAHVRAGLRRAGVLRAIREHDDAGIFNWLMESVSYQGVSDAAARAYMDQHGVASAYEIASELEGSPACHRLGSYWAFTGCGYRKNKQTCAEPSLLASCPLPRLDLRNGALNQTAFGLFLFMRDVAGGDFVGWIDQTLKRTSPGERASGWALIEPLRHVHGLSWKVLSMAMSGLLLAGGTTQRPLWRDVGADMIAVDTLVHAWLHRTGILKGLKAKHPYGPGCYGEGHCADILRVIAGHIDARAYNNDYPAVFPRFVQYAVWRFCAQDEFGQCNGLAIDDRRRCALKHCILFDHCGRVRLGRVHPAKAPAIPAA